MRYSDWGNGLRVSRLCFRALPMGPIQLGLEPRDGAPLILEAFRRGINFVDTAQVYGTYEHIRLALEGWAGTVHIATKSVASSYEDMERAVEEALESMGLDYIDIFHFHAARVGVDVFEERAGAFECLKDYRARGIVGRIGIATHSVPVVTRAADEPDIDVIFPLINVAGLGILCGERHDMEHAIAAAHRAGKKLYAMKVYGGGNLLGNRRQAMEYAMSLEGVDVVAVGMVTEDELAVNLALVDGGEMDEAVWDATSGREKQLLVLDLCQGCGACLEHCPQGALTLEDGTCLIDRDACVLCGYCAPHCPQFAIRIV